VSPLAGGILAVAAPFFLPASVAILGLEGNLLKAVYPVALGRMVAGLGILYAAVLGIIAGVILALWVTTKLSLWIPVQIAFGMFAILSIFSTLGGALYERRHELGLETWHSPERTAEKERQADLKQSEQIVTEAYGQVRVGAHAKAWEMLQTWLASRGHALEDYRWVRDRVVSWNDARYADRLTEEYVERLLAAKRDGDALDVVRERLRSDQAFRPTSAAATLHIARLAAGGGGAAGVARTLLSDFGDRFAGHPLVESAAVLARHLGD
jgi:membrane protein implicated in regulation of membrane protease activity